MQFKINSNSASKNIVKLALELDHKGLERNSYEIKPFENAIQEAVYYNKGK